MSKVVESVDVAVPVHTAYNQWTQFEEFPRFMEGVQEIRQLNDTLMHWVIEIGGVRREFDAKITEQHPDERVAWTSVDGPKHAGVVTFHRLDDSHSRVTAQMEIDPEGFAENVADKTGMVDRRVKSDMARFRSFIEDRGQETGAWRGDVATPDAAGSTTPTFSAQPAAESPSSFAAQSPSTFRQGSSGVATPTGGASMQPDPEDYRRPL